jgi:hypothetical protein
MTCCQRNQFIPSADEERTTVNEKRTRFLIGNGREGRVEVVIAAHIQKKQPQPQNARCLLEVL